MAAGATTTVTVSYGVSDGTATTPASVSWTVTGTNDAPVVSGVVRGTATEDAAVSTLSALANASDVDAGTALSVVGIQADLPAGVSYNESTKSFTLDPTNAAFQSLAAGATTTVTVNYGVSDGAAITPASVSWIVTGTNDAPVIGTPSVSAVTEDVGADSSDNLTASGTISIADADTGQSSFKTTVTDDQGNLGSLVLAANGTYTYTVANSAVQYLGTADKKVEKFTIESLDGTTADVFFTINGADDVVNVAAVDLKFTAASFSGNSVPGANSTIGSFSYTDVDGGGAHTYALDASPIFSLTAAGVLTSSSALIDNTVYTLNVTLSQVGATSYKESFSIITGSNQIDTLNGASGDDVIYAQNNQDIILAGSGDDTVFGQQAVDAIHGGSGNDVLYGGGGDDMFYFTTALDALTNVDHIKDFEAGGNNPADQLFLSTSIFTEARATNNVLNANDFTTVTNLGSISASSTAHIIYDSATGSLFYDATAGNASDAVKFATLTIASGTLDSSDFKVGV